MQQPKLKLPGGMRACLFDMDGVLTQTATVHAEAWKEMFDEYLEKHAGGGEFQPFDIATDYVKYVDGRLREDGVRSFLESRGISLPEGSPDDSGQVETVHALGTRKNDRVQEIIATHGVELYPDALVLLKAVRAAGLKTAVVSASKNTPLVLDVTGIGDQFDYVMHGGIAGEMGLPGKPQPDTFIAAAEALGETPVTCVVLEDAISGVQAGRAGNFGYVVGVDRVGQRDEMLANGADIVLSNLEELIPSP
jgi:beta-phosphoglucomutase family hydrolase